MTSQLNVDTIADKAGTGPVGLTKQSAAKVDGTFDNVNATLVSSFNVTSGTDSGTGDATFNITNALSSTSDRTIVWGAWNTTDGGTSGASGNSTGGLTCCQVSVAPSASSAEMKNCMLQLAEFNSRSAKTHSGIHRDLAVRKRGTEVDHQPRLVSKIAQRHDIPTPKLDRLVELIHDIENGRRKLSAKVFFLLGR